MFRFPVLRNRLELEKTQWCFILHASFNWETFRFVFVSEYKAETKNLNIFLMAVKKYATPHMFPKVRKLVCLSRWHVKTLLIIYYIRLNNYILKVYNSPRSWTSHSNLPYGRILEGYYVMSNSYVNYIEGI